jgi:hypothetical protein
MAIPQAGETLQAAQQRALYAHLASDPDAPKTISAYDWMVIEFIDPPPIIEAHDVQWDQPVDAVDVTPRSPMPPAPAPAPPPRSARSLPPAPGGIGGDPRSYNIPQHISNAEARRTKNFNDDTWGDPTGWPIRYPRGNRSGW